MALCPFARQVLANAPGGTYVEAPWKIVHHKTIGLSEDARGLYGGTRSWPHFTVGPSGVQQHYDTNISARALENRPGGVETNRSRAIQIELVAVVERPAPPSSLAHLARLLTWIERTHGVPAVWPSGRPKKPVNNQDPGGHNRSISNWLRASGHYGHCHVPENGHWDPFYYDEEWEVVSGRRGEEDELTEEERRALARIDQRVENLQGAMADIHPELARAVGGLEERATRLEAKVDELLRLQRN